MAQHGLYQPKIAEEHIRQLYQWAKRWEIPMTRLVNELLAHGIERLAQGAEYVSAQRARGSPRKKRKKQRTRYGKPEHKSSAP